MSRVVIRKRTVFIFLLLLGLLGYANSFRIPFHYDDITYLRENATLKSFSLFMEWLGQDPKRFFLGRGLLLSTFSLNYFLNGLDTFGYHIFNFLLHFGTAWLWYLLLAGRVFPKDSRGVSLPAVFAAALFLLHPVNSESVSYISSRSSLLSTFFMLAALLLFLRASTDRLRIFPYVLSICSFVLGLAAKEAAVVLPLLLILFDGFFVSTDQKDLARRLKYHLPFWLILLAGSPFLINYLLHAEAFERTMATQFFSELRIFVFCFRLLVLPVNQSIDHAFSETVSLNPATATSMFLLAVLVLGAVLFRKEKTMRLISFGIFWILLCLSPFLVLRLNDLMAERWFHAASLGSAVGIAGLVTAFPRHAGWTRAAQILVILSFGLLLVVRNNVYRDPILLWQDAAGKAPSKVRPMTNLCGAYLERGNSEKALAICSRAVDAGSDHAETVINLASAYVIQGDYRAAERLLRGRDGEGIEIYHYNLGIISMNLGDFRQAVEQFGKVLKIRSNAAAALGSIGETYRSLGEEEKANEYYEAATRAIPQNGEDFVMQARSYSRLGRKEEARESLRSALITEPLNLNIRAMIAAAFFDARNFDEAYRHYGVMAKIAPHLPAGHIGMGKAMVAAGRPEAGRPHLRKALDLLPAGSAERAEVEALLSQ